MSNSARVLILSLVLAAAASPLFAGPAADEIYVSQPGVVTRGLLPAGPAAPLIPIADFSINKIFAMPGGELLVAATVYSPQHVTFNELLPDGRLRQIAYLPNNSGVFEPQILDMDIDWRGRLFLLHRFGSSYPAFRITSLIEIEPSTGRYGAEVRLPDSMQGIATAPDGLWAVESGMLRHLDPDTGQLGPPVADLRGEGGDDILEIETDSSGRVYFLRGCYSGPCAAPLAYYDPATGAVEAAPPQLTAATPWANSFTIRRERETPQAIYLHDGRFRVVISYRGYDGAAGWASVAPARSEDTGIFYFFEPDNWELMVKVLGGCHINNHFWVYAAASTDVEYTMTVTDLANGRQKVYQNPLGQVAATVTDSQAFFCP